MAIGVIFEMPGITQQQYEEASKKVWKGGGGKLADWPVKGVLAHMAGPMPNGWRIVDVWESKEALEQFGKVLGPIMKEAGFPDTEPKVFPLTRFIKD